MLLRQILNFTIHGKDILNTNYSSKFSGRRSDESTIFDTEPIKILNYKGESKVLHYFDYLFISFFKLQQK